MDDIIIRAILYAQHNMGILNETTRCCFDCNPNTYCPELSCQHKANFADGVPISNIDAEIAKSDSVIHADLHNYVLIVALDVPVALWNPINVHKLHYFIP